MSLPPRPTIAVAREDDPGEDLLCLCNDAFMELAVVRPELNCGLFVVLARCLRTLLDLNREG